MWNMYRGTGMRLRKVCPQEQNRTRIASMRASETQEQTLGRLEQKRTHVASMRASETQNSTNTKTDSEVTEEGLLSLPPLKEVINDEV